MQVKKQGNTIVANAIANWIIISQMRVANKIPELPQSIFINKKNQTMHVTYLLI